LADLQWTVYPHSGHPSAEGRAQDRVSSPAKDRRSANRAMQPVSRAVEFENSTVTVCMEFVHFLYVIMEQNPGLIAVQKNCDNSALWKLDLSSLVLICVNKIM